MGLGKRNGKKSKGRERRTRGEDKQARNRRRDGDVPFIVADNSAAKKILKWEPKKNVLDMCRDGWNWKILNPNGYE